MATAALIATIASTLNAIIATITSTVNAIVASITSALSAGTLNPIVAGITSVLIATFAGIPSTLNPIVTGITSALIASTLDYITDTITSIVKAIGVGISGALTAVIVPRVVDATTKYAKYLFEVDSNVKALRSCTKELTEKRDNVKRKIENERQQGGAKSETDGWMEQVQTIEREVGVLERRYQSRYSFCGLSLNCWSNYTTSKRAAKMLLDVQDLGCRGASYEMALTATKPPLLVQEVPIEPTSIKCTADYNLEQVRNSINDESAGIIGLFGMGGVGKTRLLERINNSYVGDSSFDVVVIVTASKECSIAKIQASLVKKLKLTEDPDEEHQASIIFNFLRVRSFLLLLDDLWEGLDLLKVGIPSPLELGKQYKRKVVLTTRSSVVCGKMGVMRKIKVVCLNKEESWSLFREKVGRETLDSHPLIPSLAKKVIDELGGLPLALITIGRVMNGKRDPREWEYVIDKLRAPSSVEINDSEEIVYQKLKLSYENLETTRLKECFLSCSLWPEDYCFNKNELIKIWIGLGYIYESNIQKSYNIGHGIIGILIDQCVLEETSPNSDIDLVKMHDVIRDMAHWIACDFGASKNKWVIQAQLGLTNVPNTKELWCDAECISFMSNKISELSCSALSSPSNLTSLMLGINRLGTNKIHGISFAKNFSHFSRLRFLDLSTNRLSDFPLWVCNIISLQYLNLSYNDFISIPVELKNLINLKFFYLTNHQIKNIPEGIISDLKSLEVLGLVNHRIALYNPSFFQELVCLENLKALEITVHNLFELDSLNMLSPTVQIRCLELFKLEDLTSFLLSTKAHKGLVQLGFQDIGVEHFIVERNHFPDLEILSFETMTNLPEIMWRSVVPIDVFPKLRLLTLEGCKLEHITWILHLPSLEKLEIRNCNNMKELVTRGNQDQGENTSTGQPTFPSLKVISLFMMKKLERVCDPNYHFPSLRYLGIFNCPNLKKLPFPTDIPPNLKIQSYQQFE